MNTSKLDALASQKGMSGLELEAEVRREFLGTHADWFLKRFAASGKSLNWPSVFILAGWYGWRKMYLRAATSGFAIGFCIPVTVTIIFALSRHWHLSDSIIGLWLIAVAIYGIYEFATGTIDEYRIFMEKSIQRIIDGSSTPVQAIIQSARSGGTNFLGVLIPAIPALVGFFLGVGILNELFALTGWQVDFDSVASEGPTPGKWMLTVLKGSDQQQTFHELLTHTGDRDGLDLEIRIQCVSKGIEPAEEIDLLAVTDIPITSITYRRLSNSRITNASGYMIGYENKSRLLDNIKPIDAMTSKELSNNFGMAALVSIGIQLFDENGSIDKAAKSYQHFIVDYYERIFANDPLLVEVNFADGKGVAHSVARTFSFDGVAANRDAFLKTCGLKDPYD